MPRFPKGSQEAKEHMAKIRAMKKPTEPKPPNPNKGIRKRNKENKVDIPLMGTQEVAVPEFFANKNVSKTGKISYRLVNPLTKSRNLARRQGETSIKLIRKPINDMIIMSHSTEPISLSLFSKKDREIIDRHYKVVEENKHKEVVDIPTSSPFENKERGRPEIMYKNVRINRERKKGKTEENIKMQITEQPKTTRKYTKHQTEEQRREAILESKREYAKKAYAKKKGKGILDDIKNIGKKVVNTAKNVSNKVVNTAKDVGHKVEKYVNVVVNGRNDYPPKVRNILNKVGNQIITSITIGRTPVPSVLTSALSVSSGGVFGKNLKNAPYDSLFHLFIRCQLDNGQTITMEKNEVINMDIDPPIPPNTQTQQVQNIPEGLTPITLLDNAHRIQGGKFFGYSARDNNCQDFILAIFNGSNLGNQQDRTFIKQDTKQLFGNMTGLRKLSNTITDLGAKVNEITTGAGLTEKVIKHLNKDNKEMMELSKAYKKHIKTEKMSGKGVQPDFQQYSDDDSSISSGDEVVIQGKGVDKKDYKVQSVVIDKDKHSVKQARKWLKENGYKCPKIDITDNTYRFRQLDPKKVEKEGYTKYRMKPLGKSGIMLVIAYKEKNKISNNDIMPKFPKGSQEAKEHMAKIRAMKGGRIKPRPVAMEGGMIRPRPVVMVGRAEDNVARLTPHPLLSNTLGQLHSGSTMNDVVNRKSMIGGSLGDGLYAGGGSEGGSTSGGQGLYAGGGQSGVGRGMRKKHKKSKMDSDTDSDSDVDSHYDEVAQGEGIHHHHFHHSEVDGEGMIHHHHHHISGGRLSKIGQAFNKAFNPQKNGVAKAVQHTIVQPIQNDANKVVSGFNKTFNPALGQKIENGTKVVGHYLIPALTSALGGAAGATVGALGGPIGGFTGGVAGSALGAYGGQQIDRALGIQNNTSFDGKGFKKGSPEAKAHMAKIRAMRKGKGLYA